MSPTTAPAEVTRDRKSLYLELTRPAHKLIITGIIMSALSVVVGFVPYVIAIRLSQAALRDDLPSTFTVVALVVAAFACAMLDRLLYGGGVGLCHRADAEFRVTARRRLLEHFSVLPLGWFARRSSSEVKQSVSDDVLGIHQAVGHAPSELTQALLSPLIPFVILFAADWRMALVFLGYIVVFVVASMVFMMRDYGALAQRYQAANVELSASVVEIAEGIEVVKTFGSTTTASNRYKDAVEKLTDVTYEWTKVTAGPFSLLGAFIAPGTVTAFVGLACAHFVAQGWFDFAACVPFLLLAPSIPGGLVTLATSMGYMRTSWYSLDHLRDVLGAAPLPETIDPMSLADDDLTVSFDGVSFTYGDVYDSRAKLALDNVTAELPPGTVCALVGNSGSGKTTFARLIPRFWDPTTGEVRINGADLRGVATKSLLSQTAVVFQEAMLLSLSIRDNTKLSCPEASDAEVIKAATAAQIHERILELPDGYDSIIGSAACNLSGGEAQRVAIARAILQDAPILVLDEATAHADPENECAIQDALSRLSTGRTTVVIAHRLASIAHADQILVMDDGVIVERGTHSELLALGGRYAKMWKLQDATGSVANPLHQNREDVP